jgi:hypothetical protein
MGKMGVMRIMGKRKGADRSISKPLFQKHDNDADTTSQILLVTIQVAGNFFRSVSVSVSQSNE